MQGRRILVADPRADPYLMLERSGDYYGPVTGFSGDSPAVFFLLPGADKRLAHVQSPPHAFTEEDDGSLTIRASILSRWRDEAGERNWHGFLTRGAWSEC
jgi:hypothetical protein